MLDVIGNSKMAAMMCDCSGGGKGVPVYADGTGSDHRFSDSMMEDAEQEEVRFSEASLRLTLDTGAGSVGGGGVGRGNSRETDPYSYVSSRDLHYQSIVASSSVAQDAGTCSRKEMLHVLQQQQLRGGIYDKRERVLRSQEGEREIPNAQHQHQIHQPHPTFLSFKRQTTEIECPVPAGPTAAPGSAGPSIGGYRGSPIYESGGLTWKSFQAGSIPPPQLHTPHNLICIGANGSNKRSEDCGDI